MNKLLKQTIEILPLRQPPPGSSSIPLQTTLSSVEYKEQPKVAPFHDNSERKYVYLGLGSIGKPAVALLEEFLIVNYSKVYLVDQTDMRNEPALQDALKRGATFIQKRLEDEDWEPFFKHLDLRPFDVVIDLTTDSNGPIIIEALKKMSVMYLNTSQEINWHFTDSDVFEGSILKRTKMVEVMHLKVNDPNNASHIYDFGMNPGVISHFAFQGLVDIANLVLENHPDEKLEGFLANKQYNLIAKHLNLHTVHSSEIDTQISRNYKPDGTFVCTWSVIGLLEEAFEPAQAGWGTHERILPEDAVIIGREGVGFKGFAYQKLHQSYVPDEEFVGMVIPHGEAFTLNRALTAENYSPTVHYVYKLPSQTLDLVDKMTFEELKSVKQWKVFNSREDDLVGEDRVGALLIFPKNPITGENHTFTYWFGSILGQGSSPFFGPTSMQVSSGVLTALKYLVENNKEGPMYPEKLPLDYVIRHTLPYMGKVVSSETPWRPVSTQFADLAVPGKAKS